MFVSNGTPRAEELLGTSESLDDARGFFTRQHGENTVYEILKVKKSFANN